MTNQTQDSSQWTSACCSLPPVSASYSAKGSRTTLPALHNDSSSTTLHLYSTGSESSETAIVFFYDIFGYHPNALQAADRFAALVPSVGVYVPDILNGATLPEGLLGDRPKLMQWVGEHGSYDKHVRPRLQQTLKYLAEKGVKRAVFVGFCWGAKMALTTAREGPNALLDGMASGKEITVEGVAQIHPSAIAETDYNDGKLTFPVAFLPSQDEPDLVEIYNTVKKSYPQSIHHRFESMHHGFCGARGDWKDANVAKRATEALELAANFFKKVLSQ